MLWLILSLESHLLKNEPPIEDYFSDEHLFLVSTKSPWFADIANYWLHINLCTIPHQNNIKIL